MARPRSALIVIDSLQDNGSLRWMHQLTGLWLQSAWAVRYFALKPALSRMTPALPAGASVTYGDEAGRRFRKAFPTMLLRGVRSAVASDVVLVIGEVGLSLPFAYVIARLARRPFVVYVQSIPEHAHETHLSERERPIWRYCLTRADAVVCVSPAGAESAIRMGVEPSKVTVASTGIDVDAVRQRACPDGAFPLRCAVAPSLVACGELAPRKGYDILIRALAEVLATGRRVRLVLIGRGQDGPALERLAHELGVSDAVTFLGHVENPLPEIARAAAFVHTARVEAVGLVLLEAIALGVPTIAADCEAGGPRMVLDGGRFGRLVEPESVQALAEAICAHVDHPAHLARQARLGEAYLRERFPPSRTAGNFLDVLNGLRASRPRTRRGATA